jgi:muconate cycloisomerase
MKIVSIDAFLIDLPFRFSFKHSLASRSNSQNVIVKVVIADGARISTGWGEGVPRDYVTGENCHTALATAKTEFAPRCSEQTFSDTNQLIDFLVELRSLLRLDSQPKGAAWCAIELAVLDAAGRSQGKTVAELLSGRQPTAPLTFGAVIPFGGRRALNAVLWFYRVFGFETVKIKVGDDLDLDLYKLKKAREILPKSVKLRVDANCAWSAQEAIRAAEKMRPFNVLSYEQPVAADDLEGLSQVTASIPELVMADESLCTVDNARLLAEQKLCSAFNIRLSKVGGLIAAGQIAQIAHAAGIKCQMGAQVGESGILSAAGRTFAALHPDLENYEGSNNLFLLKEDITAENLNVGWGGKAQLLRNPGLGVCLIPERLHKVKISGQSDQIETGQRLSVMSATEEAC